MKTKYYIASTSHAKDSTSLVLNLIERGEPLDEVIFFDTTMEYNSIYRVRDQIRELLIHHDIKYTELKPSINPYQSMLFDANGADIGNGFCNFRKRWFTTEKCTAIDNYKAQITGYDIIEYIGIAYDEKNRISYKTYPLVDWGMTQADNLSYCLTCGIRWNEFGYELYDLLDRVSCWTCGNKNMRELYHIYRYLPYYWSRLIKLQTLIREPFKDYKSLFDIHRMFTDGYIPTGANTNIKPRYL